jgi:hypothetical protein
MPMADTSLPGTSADADRSLPPVPAGLKCGGAGHPPPVPTGFWQADLMREGLAGRHLGHVIRSYWLHPFLAARNLEDAGHLRRWQRLAICDVRAGHGKARHHRQARERIVRGC